MTLGQSAVEGLLDWRPALADAQVRRMRHRVTEYALSLSLRASGRSKQLDARSLNYIFNSLIVIPRQNDNVLIFMGSEHLSSEREPFVDFAYVINNGERPRS